MVAALGMVPLKLDDKNRIILPPRSRPDLSKGAYLTSGQDSCLFLFTLEQFESYQERYLESAPPEMPAIAFDRIFFASVSTQKPDSQGRITIPAKLREYAGLTRDITLIGMKTRIEIWDAGAWDAYSAEYEPPFSELKQGVR
jgi:MraZ protein